MKNTLKTPSRLVQALFTPAMAVGVLCPSLAMAQLVADESFQTGGDWDAGEYITPGPVRTDAMEGSPGSPDIGLVWQEPVIPGFTGEWLVANGALGGEPNPANPGWNSLALLPTATAQGNSLVFTFVRTKDSAYLGPFVEFNATLSGTWTLAQHGVNASISAVDGGTFETVTVTIPKNGAARLFARLVVPPPTP